MKNSFIKIMTFIALLGLFGFKSSDDPSKWNTKKIDKWFEKGAWLNGWQVKPDPSINRKEFAILYFKNKERWDKAFSFMKNNDLTKLEIKRYDIDGNNVYALIQEYMSKDEQTARYEAHEKYVDIQYVVSGKELMGLSPMADKAGILEPYNAEKDIIFLSVGKIVNYKADPGRFFIFLPSDIHRPGLRDGESIKIRKAVIKVKVD